MSLDPNDKRWLSDTLSLMTVGVFMCMFMGVGIIGWRMTSMESRFQDTIDRMIELRHLDARILEHKIDSLIQEKGRR